MNLFKDEKGISNLIATLILIAVAVVGGAFAYTAFRNQAQSTTGGKHIQVQSLDLTVAPSGSLFSVTVKNSGTERLDNVEVELIGSGGSSVITSSRSWSVSSQTDWEDYSSKNQMEIRFGQINILEYALSTATLQQSIDTQIPQDSLPTGLFWKGDGTKLYEIGWGLAKIYEHDVSTPWDISEAVYTGENINTQDFAPQGLFWKDDGTKLYEIDKTMNKIYEYDVDNAWDLDNAVYQQSIETQDWGPTGLFWKSDGTKLYEIGDDSGKIYEYDVDNAWDLDNASYTGENINTQDSWPRGLFWKPDGTKLYEIGQEAKIYEYDVSTPWDISTATFQQSIGTQDAYPTGLFWKSDGTKLYEIGMEEAKIYEYDVDSYSTGTWTSVWKDFGEPKTFTSLDADASIPGASDVEVKVEVSDDGSSVKDSTGFTSLKNSPTMDLEDLDNASHARLSVKLERGSTPTVDNVSLNYQSPSALALGSFSSGQTVSESVTVDVNKGVEYLVRIAGYDDEGNEVLSKTIKILSG